MADMRPGLLPEHGLDRTVKEFCDSVDRSGTLRAHYHSTGLAEAVMAQTTSAAIYGIIREWVHNTLKYSNASHVVVLLQYCAQDGLIVVTVEDDGKGFDRSIAEQPGDIGWRCMLSWVKFLNGVMDIQYFPDYGFSVLIEIAV